eukprot:SAG11_NODE_191_length_12943_cov_3.853706_13_plen_439_part_00
MTVSVFPFRHFLLDFTSGVGGDDNGIRVKELRLLGQMIGGSGYTAGNFLCVKHDVVTSEWAYDDTSGGWPIFVPRTSDVLLAEVDFETFNTYPAAISTDLSSFAKTIGGIRFGYDSTTSDIQFTPGITTVGLRRTQGDFALTGSFVNGGTSNCTACAVGFAAIADAESCHECRPGLFAESDGMDDCTPCAVGRFSDPHLQASTVRWPGIGLCSNCEPGFFTNVTETAVQYPFENVIVLHGYVRYARACVADAHGLGSTQSRDDLVLQPRQSVQQCSVLCDADPSCLAFEYGVEYGGLGGGAVGNCWLQTRADAEGCDGAYYNLDLYVKDATHGVYDVAMENRYRCQSCPAGTFTSEMAAESYDACIECDAGRYSPEGATVRDMCRDCPAGRTSSSDKVACFPCERGHVAVSPGEAKLKPHIATLNPQICQESLTYLHS